MLDEVNIGAPLQINTAAAEKPPHELIVLIVDDNRANLAIVAEYLDGYGYTTLVAGNGNIALTRAKRFSPDLILLDIMLPDMDGFEICQRLKADPATQDIPVIFMTALTNIADKVKGFQAGAVDYLTKPIQVEEILARVKTHLRMRELTQNFQKQTQALARANVEIQRLNNQLRLENLKMNDDLRESERKYRTLMEEMSDGYVVIREGKIFFVNQAFCEMHGFKTQEVLHQEFSQLVHPENRQEMAEVSTHKHDGLLSHRLLRYLRLTKDGQGLATEMTIKTTYYDNWRVNIGLCRDITERVKMEARLQETSRMAYLGRIMTSLSHEIRNPLSAIKMTLQILNKCHQFQDNDARRMDIAIKEMMRLERILAEVLDFARPLTLHKTSCQINEMLASCVDLLQPKFDLKQLTIIRTFDTNLPEIQADGEKLSQACINVLLNACDVSKEENIIRVTSRYCAAKAPPQIEVIIEDEGAGIPETLLSEIFKPFFTTKEKGTGVGLTNVKKIIDAHQGSIDVENREPCGTRFRISLSADG